MATSSSPTLTPPPPPTIQNFLEFQVGIDNTTSIQYATAITSIDNKLSSPNHITQEILEQAGIDKKIHQKLILRAISNYDDITTTTTITTSKKVAPRLNMIKEPTIIWNNKTPTHHHAGYIARIFIKQELGLIVGNDSTNLCAWNLLDGTLIHSLPKLEDDSFTIVLPTATTTTTTTTSSFQILSGDETENLRIWNWNNITRQFQHERDFAWLEPIWSILFTSPDESHILIGGSQGNVSLIRMETLTVLRTVNLHDRAILSLAICHHDNTNIKPITYVLAGSGLPRHGDNKTETGMTLFQFSNFSIIHSFGGHSSYVRDVGWISNDKCFSTSADGKVLIFSISSKSLVKEINIGEDIWCMDMSQDCSLIVLGTGADLSYSYRTGRVHFINTDTWEVIRHFSCNDWHTYSSSITVSTNVQNGKYLLAVGTGNGDLTLLEIGLD
jgi:WD40 repeat protein